MSQTWKRERKEQMRQARKSRINVDIDEMFLFMDNIDHEEMAEMAEKAERRAGSPTNWGSKNNKGHRR